MRKLLPIIGAVGIAILALSHSVHGGDGGNESLFSVGAGARALGLGGGFTSLADDATAVYYNPAGMSRLDLQELTFMHMSLFEGTTYNYASYVLPTLRAGSFGIGYMILSTDDIARRSEFAKLYEFDYFTSELLISYSYRIQGPLSLGVTGKLVSQEIDTYSDNGLGLDFGVVADLSQHFSLGFTARDAIAPELKLDGADESVPRSFTGGVALRDYRLGERTTITGSFELEKFDERSVKVHAGGELLIDAQYAVRAGYDRDNLALGLGYRWKQFRVDYAYKVIDDVEDSHRFSFSFDFGPSIDERREAAQQEAGPDAAELLEQERARQFALYKEKADYFYNRYRLDSAQTYYQRALAFDEGNEQIIGTLAAIDNALEYQREQEQRIAEMRQQRMVSIDNYLSQARTFYEKQNFQAAQDILSLVFDIDPDNAEATELRGQIQAAIDAEIARNLSIARVAESGHMYLRAFEAYNRILEIEPANEVVRGARNRVAAQLDLVQQREAAIRLFREGKYSEARRRFESVTALDPGNELAQDYIKRIDSVLAKPPSLEDIQKDSETWQLYLDGLRHMRDREYEKAIQAWRQVLKRYPGNPNTLNNIEQARLRMQSEKGEN